MHMTAEQLQGIAKRLKECRKSRHWTQEKTAEILDITYSSYSKIENGFQQPGIDLLIKICRTFGKTERFNSGHHSYIRNLARGLGASRSSRGAPAFVGGKEPV